MGMPVMSEQHPAMIPMLSAQGSFGLVANTRSNPIMVICCGAPPPNMSLGAPFQTCASIREEDSSAAVVLTPPSAASPSNPPLGYFNRNQCNTPERSVPPAPTSQISPPGCWSTGSSSASCPARTAAPECGEAQQAKKSAKRNTGERTTVMLRNVPCFFTRDMLVELLDSLGFAAKYDFVHLAVDTTRLSCLGFGFVNFRTQVDALHFFEEAQGYQDWQRHSNKVLAVSWSNPLQGLGAQIHRYRNSNIMHPSVSDQCKPLLFGSNGERIPFPCPTVEIRAARTILGSGSTSCHDGTRFIEFLLDACGAF